MNLRYTCRVLAFAVVTLVAGTGASAEDVSVIDGFIGTWEGEGRLFGIDATFSMQWERVLDEQFVRLTFRNRLEVADGEQRGLDAIAFYRPRDDGGFDGTWFDSRGSVHPLSASADQATLTTSWGTPETEQGRTVYHLISAGQLDVQDVVLRGEEWQPFGRATYRRSDSPETIPE
jgi:hypothetical protein